MRSYFLIARHNFDKELRKEKRKYALNKAQHLTYMKHVDMTFLWKAINQFNIRKIENIPMAVYVDGNLSSPIDQV